MSELRDSSEGTRSEASVSAFSRREEEQRKNASRSDAPRSAGTIASSLIFPLRFLALSRGGY